jgi:hypothetical protein
VQDLAHSSTWDPAGALEVARLIHEANRQLRALDGLSQPVFRRHASEVQLPYLKPLDMLGCVLLDDAVFWYLTAHAYVVHASAVGSTDMRAVHGFLSWSPSSCMPFPRIFWISKH